MSANNILDLVGLRVNHLSVIEKTDGRYNGGVLWRCSCVCGRENVLVKANILKAGRIKSCGCKTNELISKARTTHGCSKNPETIKTYQAWRHMRERCEKPKHKSFPDYGGRGISVCERWQDFSNFYSDMGDLPFGMTIERIDNNKGYSPENCRWATQKEQANNRRNNRLISLDGITKTLSQWSEFVEISYDTLSLRMARGWTISEAFFTPVKKQKNSRRQMGKRIKSRMVEVKSGKFVAQYSLD